MAYDLDKKDIKSAMDSVMNPLWLNAKNASGLMKSVSGPIQDIEDTLHQLLNNRDINTSVGKQLDDIGLILGEDRNGRLDSEYRTILLTIASRQGSSGTTRDIKNISKLVTGANKCKVFNHYPTSTYTWVNKPVNYEESVAIQEAHMAGCHSKVLWTDEVNYVGTAAYPVIKKIYDGFSQGTYIPPAVNKGVTMSPPSASYTEIPDVFVINDSLKEITFIEGAGAVQGQTYTSTLVGGWGVGYGNTPTSVTFKLRSPSNWVAGNASFPQLNFVYQSGFFLVNLSDDLTMEFTAPNQTQEETVNWLGGNTDIEDLAVQADGEGIGFIIEDIVFDPEPF